MGPSPSSSASPSPQSRSLSASQTCALLDIIVATSEAKRQNLGAIYLGRSGPELPSHIAEYFPRQKSAAVRADLLRFLGPFAQSDARVLVLAESALADRSRTVRGQALFLFARSSRSEALPLLQQWTPPSSHDVDLLDRAIRSLKRHDLSEWIRHTPYTGLLPFDFITYADDAAFRRDVDLYIGKQAPELIPALEAALGSISLAP